MGKVVREEGKAALTAEWAVCSQAEDKKAGP
jgi:hypothetical protein